MKLIKFTNVFTLLINCTITAGLVLTLNACSSSSTKSDAYQGMSAEQIYKQGKEFAKKEKYDKAIKDFEALEARYPYGDYTCKAKLALIHSYYKTEEYASALAAADRFIRMYPNHKNIDYVYYLKGLIGYDENFSTVYRYFPLDRSLRDPSLAKQSFESFKVLLEQYPSSKYVTDAKKRMINLRNNLAHHELAIAQYYLNKGAYIAAANRSGYIINQFEGSESIADALIIMIKAYRAMNMTQLANDALATLNKNFPNYPKDGLKK